MLPTLATRFYRPKLAQFATKPPIYFVIQCLRDLYAKRQADWTILRAETADLLHPCHSVIGLDLSGSSLNRQPLTNWSRTGKTLRKGPSSLRYRYTNIDKIHTNPCFGPILSKIQEISSLNPCKTHVSACSSHIAFFLLRTRLSRH